MCDDTEKSTMIGRGLHVKGKMNLAAVAAELANQL